MATTKEHLAQDIAKAVGAGKPVAMETVDFNNPNRPKTCLEVDFPILGINAVSKIEAASGAAKKPIYQMSKWWARRQSSVFRSMLLAASMKAPVEPSHAAKDVWGVYYANHKKKGAFKHLSVVDIFMGGGTTLVEGTRLGMQMSGNDLNPVAWFVVKQELANVDLDEVKQLLADIEADVKPQITPFFYCDGPNGEKGKWTHKPTGQVMDAEFDPLALKLTERTDYSYEGPEIIYTFWGKHGPCQVTGCGHRTPIMTTPVVTVKTISVKYWEQSCSKCSKDFHVEDGDARMAPDVPLYVAPDEYPFSVIDPKRGIVCPHCGHAEIIRLGKGKNKKVELSLLVHPQWLAGSPKNDTEGRPFGGSAQDDAASTARWDQERAGKVRLLEVRGLLPETVTCPETGTSFNTGKLGGTVPKKSTYTCRACGTAQDILDTVKVTSKTGPIAAYVNQCFSPGRRGRGSPYNGRFFAPFDLKRAKQYDAATAEWERRKDDDLAGYWPTSELSQGWKTHGWAIPEHGYTHYWTMFNPRQLLVLATLLKSILNTGKYSWDAREYVLGAFQQYLRNQNMFCFWHERHDMLTPHLSNNNYHPKHNSIENNFLGPYGYGNWISCRDGIIEGAEWKRNPWELVSADLLQTENRDLASQVSGRSQKVYPGDQPSPAEISQGSSTDLSAITDASVDMVITDPPFGEIMQYAELADFFYVWLRLALSAKYPREFGGEYSPKSMEAVSNPFREPENPDGFYQRLLTQCWHEANRILKPGGILAFTFHHSEDEPWVAVLESLFEAGFYLEATYPIRSDETKGDNAQFGAQKIEYDIIHVCRKRTEEPKPVSWARMRREVLQDVHQLQQLLENHIKEGLPTADIQVIRRGKALEYFSRHYGKVLVEEGRPLTVSEALIGINQLIEEESDVAADLPPGLAEPLTRQFLRIFRGKSEVDRDQMQKFLRGSGASPDAFEQRGWSIEKSKRFELVPSVDFALQWKGRQRKNLTSDYDQAWFLIGACHEGTGINAAEQLRNENFMPHPALKPLLDWFSRNGVDSATRQAAIRAATIYNAWADTHPDIVSKQMELFT